MLHQQPTLSRDSRKGSKVSAKISSEAAPKIQSEGSSQLALPEFAGTPTWKRLCDFVGSILLIVAFCPILLAISVFVKLVSRGPIFFTQSRMGAGGKQFTIFKFRTMYQDDAADETHRYYIESLASSDNAAEKPDYEDRLIPGGKFLRSHSLDELPQLFNVLIGTMSLVGPRPEVLEWEEYQQWQLRRFEVLPGMTGLWQVSGKNSLSFKRMVELDIQYIDNRSLALDTKLLWKTIAVVVFSDNK